MDSEIISYSVYRGEQTYASEMKMKRHNLATESCLTAGDESGNSGGIFVYSIKLTNSSRWIKFTQLPNWNFTPLQHFYPLIVNSPKVILAPKITKVIETFSYPRILEIIRFMLGNLQ